MADKHGEESRELVSNPFLAGRTEAAERYGHLSKNAAQWRRNSAVLILCCAACVCAVIFMAGRVTVVPYIVQVDAHGYEIAVEPAAPSRIDARLMISHVARYVWSLKTVFNDPVVIGETETVQVTVNSVLSMSAETWQAEWTEERYTLGGDRISQKHYRGIFSTAVVTPDSMREVLQNPLGIFITDFNFSEIL